MKEDRHVGGGEGVLWIVVICLIYILFVSVAILFF